MSIRFSHKNRYLAAAVLVLALALVACSPFGRRKQATQAPAVTPTATSLPTQVPASAVALATPTPTRPTVLATPTPTSTVTPVPTAEEEPTSAPTVEPTADESKEALAPTVIAAATRDASAWLETGNVILNGSFEEGFGLDGVGLGWTALFTTGDAVYAWQDDTDGQHTFHGTHAQLMRIMGPTEPDTFVGIYQAVDVVAGETYTLALHGVIRSSTASEDHEPLAFRLQWAIAEGGGVGWRAVHSNDWTDLGWNDVKLDAKWPEMNAYVVQITPQSNTLTLFIRGWSKWPLFQSEVKFYVDGISLEGPIPAARGAAALPEGQAGMPATGANAMRMIPVAGAILVSGLAFWEARKIQAR